MDRLELIVGCEESQEVTKAFRKKGVIANSCDIKECSGGEPSLHLKMDVFKAVNLYKPINGIFHPDCTFLTNSGVRWLYNKDGSKNIERWVNLENAINFFNRLKKCTDTYCLENPIPHKYAREGFESVINGKWVEGIGKYNQLVQPYQFGHGERKATCLWLKGLPKLKPTDIVEGREQRIWKLPPSKNRAELRSKTYPGIAKAMADQWTKHLN